MSAIDRSFGPIFISAFAPPTSRPHFPSSTKPTRLPAADALHFPTPTLSSPSQTRARSWSAPPILTQQTFHDCNVAVAASLGSPRSLAALTDDSGDEDDWTAPDPDPVFGVHRAVSIGSKQYGFTSLGRGFNWLAKEEEERNRTRQLARQRSPRTADSSPQPPPLNIVPPYPPDDTATPPITVPSISASDEPASSPPPILSSLESPNSSPFILTESPPASPQSLSPPSQARRRPSIPSRSPTSSIRPPSRRRSSHKRVSLVAGRVSVIEDPPPLPEHVPRLARYNSQSSFLSVAASTRPPTPVPEEHHFLGVHTINDYLIDGEVGRGAYGMVKRAREKLPDDKLGPELIIKQVIKSRILADCWKKHPKHGTIPIEIYVMSAISNATYVLPPRRPWDPSRPSIPYAKQPPSSSDWEEGAVVNGHPNICSLIDFFEDSHYYYLVMPSCSPPPPAPEDVEPPTDLFDLVELYPDGLPPHLIRSYLGQIADALCFLHSKDIVHRDIKDENVVLGFTEGKCILIDFGSSGIVRKGGWDTFSGTLDYAGPEILRGESYNGKEQDVWAFGVVAFVLLVGECPFVTPAEAQEGLASPFAKARMALDERCCGDEEDREDDGEEPDGGGRLGDARKLVMACLQVEVAKRPTIEKVLSCQFLAGKGGW